MALTMNSTTLRAWGPVVILLLATVMNLRPLRAQDLPAHVGKVNDFAEVLDTAQRDALETQLAELERATSAEVAVVTMRTLGARTVEDYATDLFNTWGIGKKDRDNGVLILVAVQDRAMRIEVGYGLEGILPDGLAGTVIRESFLPHFRNDDYRAGLLEGTARVIEIVRRNETLTAEQREAFDQAARDEGKTWGLTAFVGIFVGIGAFMLGTAAGAQIVVQLIFGAVFMSAALYLSPFIAPRAGVMALTVFAIGVTGLGFVLGRRPKWRRSLRGPGKGGGRWISEGTSESGSSSSSSSSSSGGSFGGGSSGGGGASGRW
jgi:uncharacterized protein